LELGYLLDLLPYIGHELSISDELRRECGYSGGGDRRDVDQGSDSESAHLDEDSGDQCLDDNLLGIISSSFFVDDIGDDRIEYHRR